MRTQIERHRKPKTNKQTNKHPPLSRPLPLASHTPTGNGMAHMPWPLRLNSYPLLLPSFLSFFPFTSTSKYYISAENFGCRVFENISGSEALDGNMEILYTHINDNHGQFNFSKHLKSACQFKRTFKYVRGLGPFVTVLSALT